MRNLIIAAAIAVTSIVSFAPASYADTVTTVTTRERPMHRGWHHPPRRHCYVKVTKVRHHGQLVVRKTRVCR
ncbi:MULTISPECIES: hypothetical protein [Rhizobium]|uniref:Uncharacterized protein n=1 Tax=Rhizobium rhododendri TaxID=2506430 RepID=A0ABY8IJT4_9HYPH|nr:MULTISPECIES: hypothetical protein [Rhizobium]MBZ5760070.1 hypothetical protein [Rhizobium sp. VS19-DR96]MBZ5766449.1 hypothetical protein [Rhizobium sp. VS19-DR129.2]MBZ5774208.1 hypothetical protein [Rhizobium sp. VS19-DRK62.2]MBZ5785280.1 hypothetical protein [Rhizobium sp. VS19-DR121]MBZ5802879.1 hypothetical protein [Rhizobium sp. VS19-DR181]